MSTNLTDEIKKIEEAAKQSVINAKGEASTMLAKTKADLAKHVKESKQAHFRSYRENLLKEEAKASEAASQIVKKGHLDAQTFTENHKNAINEVAQWVAEEVVSRYGRS